jgi:hypothetical protein
VYDGGRRAVCFSVLLGGDQSYIAVAVSVLSSCHDRFGPYGGVRGDLVEDWGRMAMVGVGGQEVDVGAVSRGQDFYLAFEGDG